MDDISKETLEKIGSLTGLQLCDFMVCLCESYLDKSSALESANARIAQLESEIKRLNELLHDSFPGHLLGVLRRKDDEILRLKSIMRAEVK